MLIIDKKPVVVKSGSSGRSGDVVKWPVLAVVSAGGAIGALARYGLGVLIPHAPGAFPWATFGINISGCLLIGVLMALIADVWPSQRLIRPFVGTGILGGYTTFSTYVVDIQQLLAAGRPVAAFGYLFATVVGALAAVYAGSAVTKLVLLRPTEEAA
jgi:CrcB protein